MSGAARAVLLGCALAATRAAGASEVNSDLSAWLSRARVIVAAEVTDVRSYDSGRFTVANLAVHRTLHGDPDDSLAVVERHDLPSSQQSLQRGEHVLALLVPARRNSALTAALPAVKYFEIVNRPSGVITTPNQFELEEPVAIVSRLLKARRQPELDSVRREVMIRALVFDEVAARHPTLVADGARALARLSDLAKTLTPAEQVRLEATLQRIDLPTWVRIELVEAIATRDLRTLVPALRQLPQPGPNLQRAAWKALQRLGSPPTSDDLRSALHSDDAATRAAAVEALTAALGEEARPQLEQLAERDPDRSVRLAAIEALGGSGQPALPALGRVFIGDDWTERRAAGRAISAVGGRAAAETLARLAFEGPPDAQKFAVTLLLLSAIPHDDPLVQHISTTHPDGSVRQIIESGLDIHEH